MQTRHITHAGNKHLTETGINETAHSEDPLRRDGVTHRRKNLISGVENLNTGPCGKLHHFWVLLRAARGDKQFLNRARRAGERLAHSLRTLHQK